MFGLNGRSGTFEKLTRRQNLDPAIEKLGEMSDIASDQHLGIPQQRRSPDKPHHRILKPEFDHRWLDGQCYDIEQVDQNQHDGPIGSMLQPGTNIPIFNVALICVNHTGNFNNNVKAVELLRELGR